MRILSVHVKNYRIHRDLRVTFDRELTLIGGPNESGKSTLVEAIHRCLFLPARGNTERHRNLASTLHGDVPEVELVLELADKQVTLLKRFSGANGSTQLTVPGEPTRSGEEAENRLEALLTIQQNRTKDIDASWSHLWVWQGKSWQDPAGGINGEHTSLVQRLQRLGGAAVMISPKAEEISANLQALKEDFFTAKGRSKTNGELANAEARVGQAEAAYEDAKHKLQRLQDAAEQMRGGKKRIESLRIESEALKVERTELEAKKETLRQLSVTRDKRQVAAEAALEALNKHKALLAEIDQLNESISTQTRELAPKNAALALLKEQAEDARSRAENAQTVSDQAQDAADAANTAYGLAELRVLHRETVEKIADLDQRLAEIAGFEKALQDQQSILAKLPAVDNAGVAHARRLDRDLREARAVLKGMAAEIVVERADGKLQIGNTELVTGQSQIITQATELRLGDLLKLVIRPGSAEDLDVAQREVQTLERALKTVLLQWGLPDLEQAEKVLRERERLDVSIAEVGRVIQREEPEKLRKNFKDAQAELERLAAELKRRHAPPATDLPLEALRTALVESRASREDAQKIAFSARELARQEKDTAKSKTEQHQQAVQQLAEAQHALAKARDQLKWKEDEHGDGPQRLKVLNEREQRKILCERELAETQNQIKHLQPELIEADEARLNRALKRHAEAYEEAVRHVNEAGVLLRLDGTSDPAADLERAQADLEVANSEFKRVSIRAQAIKLLAERFAQEQEALKSRFSAPLAARITDYLKTVFGPEAKASVVVGNDGLTGINLERLDRGNFDFPRLSIGCQEQVAAAVRLAVAELLADCPEGCLPVVFDDAFTNSDQDRTAALQRMLDHAARRGLQVIIASCNPSDYNRLGAKTVTLQPSTVQAPTSRQAPMPPTYDDVDEEAEVAAIPEGDAEQEGAFLEALRDKGGSAGNGALRAALGWSDEAYEQAKGNLLARGAITTGRGRGGSVALVE